MADGFRVLTAVNRFWPGTVLLLLLGTAFGGLLAWSSGVLPERVASHFDAAGVPDGWMPRGKYLAFTALMGLGLPAALVALFALTCLLPDWMVNLPRKEYWLGPTRRQETRRYIIRHSLWLAALVLALTSTLHVLTTLAHNHEPVQLPMVSFTATMALFLGGVAVWAVALVRHFARGS